MNQKIKRLLNSGIFWTILVGIFGVILSIWLSNKEREPVYFISEKPYLIFDKDAQVYDVYLVEKNGLLVEENVYNTSLVLWNKGELTIAPDDVRKEVKILFDNAKKYRILGARIIDYFPNSENIGKFSLSADSIQIKPNWKFFDPNFAIKIQVLCSAKEPLRPYVEGFVLGNSVREIANIGGYGKYIGILIFSLLFFIIGVSGLYVNIKNWIQENPENRIPLSEKLFLGFMIVFTIFIAGAALYSTIISGPVPVF